MLNPRKIQLMTRLAILEKERGKELRSVRESYRSDYVGIPLLKNAFRVTAVFFAASRCMGSGEYGLYSEYCRGYAAGIAGDRNIGCIYCGAAGFPDHYISMCFGGLLPQPPGYGGVRISAGEAGISGGRVSENIN